MKRFFLRLLAYVGLYAEIFSATCRWLSSSPRRELYRTFVTKSLIAAGYLPPLPPPREAIELHRAQQEIIAQHNFKIWLAAQPETIQACLRISRKALAAAREASASVPNGVSYHSPPGPAIPDFVLGRSQVWWPLPEGCKLDEDGDVQ